MIRYFCDKCDKEIGERSELFKIEIEPPEIRRWADDAETGTYIMCYDCVRLLNKWVENTCTKPEYYQRWGDPLCNGKERSNE